ncbi:MAG: HEAT repeat domain-containing protein [Anaerolineae bacterium]|jgi:HEAT repeat protein|nr:HEAT repeat domain-containing protein [Anaerolineae bacterium]
MNNETPTKPDLKTTIAALEEGAAGGKPFAKIFYGLSDLNAREVAQMKAVWQTLDTDYREKLARQIAEISESDYEMDYQGIGMMLLDDPTPEVRIAGIDTLWSDESIPLMRRLMVMAQQDPAIEVQAAAVSALGRFILMGELGDLDENEAVKAQKIAIQLWKNEQLDLDVRRRALEAIANCGHEIVPGAIRQAYRSDEERMKVSAVFAMGRTYDEQWSEIVLKEIDSDQAAMRYEAARAAGELELIEAVPKLAQLLIEDDDEIAAVAIWSLGEIGGREAMRALEAMLEVAEENDDQEMIEAIEEALGNASLAGSGLFDWQDVK